MLIKCITIAPFLIFAEDSKSFRQTHAYQPNGPDSITKGYAILKIRGDDEVPEEMMAGDDVDLLIVAAKALAVEYNVPFHRPEWTKPQPITGAVADQAAPAPVPSGEISMDIGLGIVVGIQIRPFLDTGTDIVSQPDGPTPDTTGWAVYLRWNDGEVEWVIDAASQAMAELASRGISQNFDAPIDPYPWLKT
jgi:hypothetical protein